MNFCQHCGTPRELDGRFCATCGRPFASPQYPHTYAGYHNFNSTHPQNLAGIGKASRIALILVASGLLGDLLGRAVLYFVYYKSIGIILDAKSFVYFLYDLIPCLIAAILPILIIVFSRKGTQKASKPLMVGVFCYLGLQIAGVLFNLLAAIMYEYGTVNLYDALPYLDFIFAYIGGPNLLSSLFYIAINLGSFVFYDLAYFLSSLCYLGSSIFCIQAAIKFSKS